MIKTILLQIIAFCAVTQNIIKKLSSCDHFERNSEFKSVVAFLLCLSIFLFYHNTKANNFYNSINVFKL